MFSGLSSSVWTQGGATVLLALVVLLILSGRLVPRQTLKDARDDRDKWERAYRQAHETIDELTQQVTALVEVGDTTEALLKAIIRQDSKIPKSRDRDRQRPSPRLTGRSDREIENRAD